MQFEELFPNWEEQILSNGKQLAESLELSQLEVMQLFLGVLLRWVIRCGNRTGGRLFFNSSEALASGIRVRG